MTTAIEEGRAEGEEVSSLLLRRFMGEDDDEGIEREGAGLT
jgi:hypothetical protein